MARVESWLCCIGIFLTLAAAEPGKYVKDKDNAINEILEDCEFNGKYYRPGQTIDTEDQCIKCVCPLTGGPTRCTGYFCSPAPCVDPVYVEGDCCPQCINGMYKIQVWVDI